MHLQFIYLQFTIGLIIQWKIQKIRIRIQENQVLVG